MKFGNYYISLMSRVGNVPIKIEEGVEVQILDGGEFSNKLVKVSGQKGELQLSIRRGIEVKLEDDLVKLNRKDDTKRLKSLHGLYRTLISNLITGVTKGYIKELEIVGVGYKAGLKGNDLELNLGLNHPVFFPAPEGIKFEVSDNVNVKISGIDSVLVGNTAAKIREIKKPEPYKGKGIRYKGEYVRRKAGKAAITTTT